MVNAKNNNGWTPLHIAAGNDAHQTATVLIQHGADVNVKDNEGDTPLYSAVINNAHQTAEVLRCHGGHE